MTFVVEVGEVERQQIEFTFNQLLGRTIIRANGREIKRSVRLFSEPVHESHVLDFSASERFQVRIEKHRKHLVASRYCVYVNNRLQACHQGV